jgi:hypothetical protein
MGNKLLKDRSDFDPSVAVNLLAIFDSRSPESRNRRLEKVIQAAAELMARKIRARINNCVKGRLRFVRFHHGANPAMEVAAHIGPELANHVHPHTRRQSS